MSKVEIDAFTACTVAEFIEPRRRLLLDGRLVESSEWETSERIEISGGIASRTSGHQKSGLLDGTVYEGTGVEAFPFVLTSEGRRIAALSWHDPA